MLRLKLISLLLILSVGEKGVVFTSRRSPSDPRRLVHFHPCDVIVFVASLLIVVVGRGQIVRDEAGGLATVTVCLDFK